MDESTRSYILNELRSRVATQNELIQKLKDHIAHYRRIEGEYLLLKQENTQAEIQIKELKQKLELSQTLTKPVSCPINFSNLPILNSMLKPFFLVGK